MKELQISNLFHTSWESFSLQKRAFLSRIVQYIRICQVKDQHEQAGYQIRGLLKQLAIDKKVWNKILQQGDFGEIAIDIFEDLTFLHEPCYQFLAVKGFHAPSFAEGKVPFGEVTWERWKILDGKFTKFLCLAHNKETKEARLELGKFLAALYTPNSSEWEQKNHNQEWNEAWLNNGSLLLQLLKPWQVDLILETYGHIRNYCISRYNNIFPSSEERSADEASSPVYSGEMWQTMHFDIADTEAFKGYEAAGKSRMHDILGYLDKKIADQQKLKSNAS